MSDLGLKETPPLFKMIHEAALKPSVMVQPPNLAKYCSLLALTRPEQFCL